MMELSPEAKTEIAEAIKIARSDGLHVHKSHAAWLKAQEDEKNKPPVVDKPKDGDPPPLKDTPPADEYEEVATLWGKKKIKKNAPPAT